MNDNFEAYKDLVELMRAAPKAQAPEGFTGKVMTTLPACNPQECAFYFFITGFFYLIMGLVLMSGFKISSNMTAVDWIRLQPQVTLGIAIWLFALGAVLMADGRSIVRLARLGTLFYIFFTVANGILIGSYFNIPHANMPIVGFIGGSVFMGFMLALAVQKLELKVR